MSGEYFLLLFGSLPYLDRGKEKKYFSNIVKAFGIFHFAVVKVLKGFGNIPTSR